MGLARISFCRAFIFILYCTIFLPAVQSEPQHIQVSILAKKDADWIADFRLPKETSVLQFARNPGDYRVQFWNVEPGFEIFEMGDVEFIRRIDGKAFASVRVAFPAKYRVLKKDYAPFSQFSTGDILFHTGQFLVCPEYCDGPLSWSFSMRVNGYQQILQDGQITELEATWVDDDNGQMVFLGNVMLRPGSSYISLFDKGLPTAVLQKINTDMPILMSEFANKLGALNERPMFFVSFDESYGDGSGSQGGTLPNQVFMHFYGPSSKANRNEKDFPLRLTWFLAHEAAHLFQRNGKSEEEQDAWIHEGAADAMAYLAIQGKYEDYVQVRYSRHYERCESKLEHQSLREVIDGGDFNAAYDCGLLLHLYIDQKLHERGVDGLFALWRVFLKNLNGKNSASESDFLRSLMEVGDAVLVDEIKGIVRQKSPDLKAISIYQVK